MTDFQSSSRHCSPRTVLIVLLVACTVGLTVAAGPAFDLVDRAAAQLMEPAGYVEAVLGGGGR